VKYELSRELWQDVAAHDWYPNFRLPDYTLPYGEPVTDDAVNHPKHYNEHPSGTECIEIVRHMTFNTGNVVKYLWRAGLKDGEPSLKDLKKAEFYLRDEIKRLEDAERDAKWIAEDVERGDV
jgi:hypothetical protein